MIKRNIKILAKLKNKSELETLIKTIKKAGTIENNEFVCKDNKQIKELKNWKDVEKIYQESNFAPIFHAMQCKYGSDFNFTQEDFLIVLEEMIKNKTTSVNKVCDLVLRRIKIFKWDIFVAFEAKTKDELDTIIKKLKKTYENDEYFKFENHDGCVDDDCYYYMETEFQCTNLKNISGFLSKIKQIIPLKYVNFNSLEFEIYED